MKLRSIVFGASLLACQGAPPTAATAAPGTQAPSAPAAAQTPSLPSVTPSATAAPRATRRNVLLLTIDSLRADMPWAGYPRAIAPNLTKLAAKATVYNRAYSVSSYTSKSVAALLSGRYPTSLYRSGWFFAGYPDANLFFPEVVQQHGARTLGVQGHLYFDRGKNLNQGFDEWVLPAGIRFDSTTDKNVTSDKLTDAAITLLEKPEQQGKQFFMWIHYMDPHDEYIKHAESPDFGKKNRDRYDSEVFFTDLHIGRLLAFLETRGLSDDTCVLVSADHGETFGEHGMYKHAFELWEVLTRVPLIVYVPGTKPQVIEQRRSAIDLAPTVLDLMGMAIPAEFVGKSLAPEVAGAPADVREPIVLDLPEDKNSAERNAIIAGDYKLIAQNNGNKYLLFNLAQDPDEKNELSAKEPAKLAELRKLLDATRAKIPFVEPYGGMKLPSGRTARGTEGPTAAPAASK